MNKVINILLATLFIVTLYLYWARPFGDQGELARNIVYLLAPFLATISAMYLNFVFGGEGKRARAFRLLFLGVLFLFIGEVSYVYFDFILKTRPFPSLADIFYLTSYPFVVLGIVSEILALKPSVNKIEKRTALLGVLIFLIVFSCVAYFGVYKAYDPSMPLFGNIISISYGIGDLIIVSLGIVLYILARNTQGGRVADFWLKILIGFIFILCADILYAKFTDLYSPTDYYFKNTMDSFWILGYVVMASAFSNFAIDIKSLQKKIIKEIGKIPKKDSTQTAG